VTPEDCQSRQFLLALADEVSHASLHLRTDIINPMHEAKMLQHAIYALQYFATLVPTHDLGVTGDKHDA
jgi:hypothetical protein